MIRVILVLVTMLAFVSCNGGGKKAPVMATEAAPAEIDYNQDATGHVGTVSSSKVDVAVKHGDGEMSISEVFEQKAELVGKSVTVKGKVTKYNPSIMGRNWVHIQDGTEYSGEFDLTITTADEVAVGEQVVFTGTLAVDRDFGYGYKYSTIIENAVLKK